MSTKKWDVYVYGDVNIDIVIPGVEKFPEPGQEDEVSVMETFVGGGAALFTPVSYTHLTQPTKA